MLTTSDKKYNTDNGMAAIDLNLRLSSDFGCPRIRHIFFLHTLSISEARTDAILHSMAYKRKVI